MDTYRKEYRPLTDKEKQLMEKIKIRAEKLEVLFDKVNTNRNEIPSASGREIALAKTKLEEAIMWAIKGLTK
jgi:hypothetical protein